MPYCPNCGDEIVTGTADCPTCEAVLGPGSAWQPLAEPPPHRDPKSIEEFRDATELRRQRRKREDNAAARDAVIEERLASPVFAVLGLLSPYIVLAVFFLIFLGESRSGWGYFGFAIYIAGKAGAVLGVISLAVSYARREKWPLLLTLAIAVDVTAFFRMDWLVWPLFWAFGVR